MSDYEKFEAGLIMICNNTAKITITPSEIIVDCPNCNFSCGFPKTKKRRRLLTAVNHNIKRKRTAEEICNEDVLLRETLALEKRDREVSGKSETVLNVSSKCPEVATLEMDSEIKQEGSREPDQKQTKILEEAKKDER